jgi:hypothetical protein
MCTLALLASCRREDEPETSVTSNPQEILAHQDAPWGADKAGFQCSIACSSLVVTPSKPADLSLRVRNHGDAPVQYHIDTCDGPTYQIQASWPNGTVVKFSDLEQQEHHPCGVTNWISLAVGKTNLHTLAIRTGTFLKDEYLFIGPELGSPIEQYGLLDMKLTLMDIESNTIQLDIKRGTP